MIGLVGTKNGEAEELAWLILNIDLQGMVVLDVLCWGKRVPAVIDTGAVVSVCSPRLVKELGLQVTPWRANRLVSVDGKEILPGGAALLSVSDGETIVTGEAQRELRFYWYLTEKQVSRERCWSWTVTSIYS